jgi:Tfp pilus assembly protein PilZ
MLLSATSALTFLPAMILILKRFLFDQRRAPRVNAPMQARLQEHNAVQFPVVNISLGGVCIQSYETLSIGERFHLELKFPNDDTITCPVRVVWQHQLSSDAEESQYEVGLRFTNLTDDASSQLETMLEKYAE